MVSFFSQAKHKFLPLPEDKRIDAVAFLLAASEVIPFFDVLGPTAFAPVKSDINGNIQKLTKKKDTDPEKYKTLHDMVDDEIAAGTTKAKNSATDALLWLKRALEFIRHFLEEVLTGEPDLTKSAKKAYEQSLKKYHGWMVQGIFSMAMKAVPYRKDFINKLGRGSSEEDVLEEMKLFLAPLAENIDALNDYYNKIGEDKSDKV